MNEPRCVNCNLMNECKIILAFPKVEDWSIMHNFCSNHPEINGEVEPMWYEIRVLTDEKNSLESKVYDLEEEIKYLKNKYE